MNATRHDPRLVCPACANGKLVRETRTARYEYRGEILDYEQSGDWCSSCEEAVLTGDDMAATEELLLDFMRQVEQRQAGELARIRRKLKLTQKQAAALTGGGHNAFSRYERGEARPLPAIMHLFRILDRHPELLDELREGRKAG
ncbi:putative zinc finger/helix-turn-helix protein, YgiT family [Desulfuromonas soudanensis]|uniref:Putative zinc finger/helix-turn-helix protein, YgiT family n=1 Tax=Desulfuromonas soudanensis TaxID=1603606 RepID=A0A0M5IL93_9BACT|nr:type II toxin-antitoxin system MqsA family antitoxin [Desulfuromonas soudanensis]ALC17048.1 putative zinc finger/helix-turn-helix protein, YgiT family [Desulfuromonas soudanensis]